MSLSLTLAPQQLRGEDCWEQDLPRVQHRQTQRSAMTRQPCNPLSCLLVAATRRGKCHVGMALLGQPFWQRPGQRIRGTRRNYGS